MITHSTHTGDPDEAPDSPRGACRWLITLSLAATANCWRWSAKDRIPDITAESDSAAFALDRTGAVWALTIRQDADGHQVLVRRRAPDGTWGTPVAVARSERARAFSSHIGVSDAGHVLAVWDECTLKGNYCSGRAVTYSAAGGWEAPHELSPGETHVAMAPNGYSVVHSAQPYDVSRAYITSWSPQTGWGAVEKTPPVGRHQTKYSVATNSAGQAVVMSRNWDSVSAMYRPAPHERWSELQAISEPGHRIGDSYDPPQLSLNENGQATLVWTDRDRINRHRVKVKRLD